MAYGCGICIYGKNENMFEEHDKVQCMIRGYQTKLKSESCESFKRDFSKTIQVKSIHNVKKE